MIYWIDLTPRVITPVPGPPPRSVKATGPGRSIRNISDAGERAGHDVSSWVFDSSPTIIGRLRLSPVHDLELERPDRAERLYPIRLLCWGATPRERSMPGGRTFPSS